MKIPSGRADRTRQLLLDTTGQIISAEGYAALSEEYLCRCSGVSRGAFRYHFPKGRYELLSAFAAGVVQGQAERLAPLEPLSARERCYLVLMSMQQQAPSAATVALLELWMASRGDTRLAESLAPAMQQSLQQFLGQDGGQGDPELLALRFFVHGASMHAFSHDFSPEGLTVAIAWLLQKLPPPADLAARLAEFHQLRLAACRT